MLLAEKRSFSSPHVPQRAPCVKERRENTAGVRGAAARMHVPQDARPSVWPELRPDCADSGPIGQLTRLAQSAGLPDWPGRGLTRAGQDVQKGCGDAERRPRPDCTGPCIWPAPEFSPGMAEQAPYAARRGPSRRAGVRGGLAHRRARPMHRTRQAAGRHGGRVGQEGKTGPPRAAPFAPQWDAPPEKTGNPAPIDR